MLVLVGAFVFAIAPGVSGGFGSEQDQEMTVVERVDLDRYLGFWYEIAKIPNRFQKKCATDTGAYYSLRDDGKINVVNRCLDGEGKIVLASGIAKVEDEASGAKLKVSFVRVVGLSLFWGDYWIIGLADDYRYAVVGTPKRDYGWILARERELPKEVLDGIFARLDRQGFARDLFQWTAQSEP